MDFIDELNKKLEIARYWQKEALNDAIFDREPNPDNPLYWTVEEDYDLR